MSGIEKTSSLVNGCEAKLGMGTITTTLVAPQSTKNHGIIRPWQMASPGTSSNCVPAMNHLIKTEDEIKKEVDADEDTHTLEEHEEHVQFNSEEDDIEVFIFDRNSLKLKSEKIQRKKSTDHQISVKEQGNSDSKAKSKPVRKNSVACSSNSNSSSMTSNDSSENSDSDSSSDSNSSDSSSSDSDSDSSSSTSSSSGSSSSSSSSSSNYSANEKKAKDKKECENTRSGKRQSKAGGEPSPMNVPTSNLSTRKIKEEVDSDEDSVKNEQNDGNLVNGSCLDYNYAGTRKSSRLVHQDTISKKNQENRLKKKLRTLLKKSQGDLTEEDRKTLQAYPKLASEVKKRLHKGEVASERLKESEDAPDLLEKKCAQLASMISRSRYLIIYTGAGISTSAKIPDYRGPNGIWTLLQKGQEVTQSLTDFSQTAEPTLTHMAIKELWEGGVCKHVVSQNVDGLHLRSGIPKVSLSELHGNMFLEACIKCGREFVRLFDVTENTRRHHHKTGRFCYHCGSSLRDSIVLFGEKGSLRWPLNWEGAEYHADKADLILCLGSSLKVLRRYPWLWCMSKPAKKRPKLCIVNLQWTPKDQFAQLKINGKCDEVMEKVMKHLRLQIPLYTRETDAIFTIATSLHPLETKTTSTEHLKYPENVPYPEKNKDLRNYIRFEPKFRVPIPYENTQENSVIKADGESSGTSDLNDCQQIDKPKKRAIKGNNFGWLGNTVANKQQKKRKLK